MMAWGKLWPASLAGVCWGGGGAGLAWCAGVYCSVSPVCEVAIGPSSPTIGPTVAFMVLCVVG